MVPTTRSSRDALSKKSPIAAGNRKSKRIQKIKKAATAAVAMTSPLRRSERRSKNLSSSTTSSSAASSNPSKGSSNSKSSGSSPSSASSSSGSKVNRQKKTKRLKRLRVEEEEEDGEEEEERDAGSSSKVNIKRVNARVYRAAFDKTEEDCHEESDKMDKSTQEVGNSGGEEMLNNGVLPSEDAKAKETSESSLSGHVKESVEDSVTPDSLVPSNATNHETSSAPEQNQSDCCAEKASQMLVSTNSMRAESRLNGPVTEVSENHATLGSSVPSNGTTHESSGAPESDQSNCHREQTSQMSSNPVLNENLIRNCSGHDKGENLISSKRKGTMMDMHSDVSATLGDNGNCNLIVDADPSRLCDNTVGTNGSCSKKMRQIPLPDVQSDQRKLINNVNQLSPKVEGVKLSTGNKEATERPQGNDVEYIRKQQRSLHLLLKPEIAKLCQILLLPDNVKNMVDSCLQYVMNNRQICTKPVSVLQAFQLSLCWIAASLLNHKLDFEASVKLAKRHLNFNCKKAMVDEIYSMLWQLKEEILFHTGNTDVTDPPKASESSNRVYSYTEVAPEVELAIKDVSKSTKEIHKGENQLGKLLLMQQEEKHKLKADIEKEKADFVRRYKIEWAAIQCCSPNDAIRRDKLTDFNKEYDKRLGNLKRKHEIRFKVLEAKQREAMQIFKESRAPVELLNVGASKELETRVKYLQTCYQAQTPNGPKNAALVSGYVATGKSSDNIVEAMTRAGSGVGLFKSPDTNFPVVVVCSSRVKLQTPPVKHADANEIDIMASEDGPVSRNKCHNIDENNNESQGNIISKHSNSREQCSAGAANMEDEGKGCQNFSCETRNGENAAQIHEADGSNDSNNGETPNLPLSDERIASLNFKSPQEHVHNQNATCLQNFENAAQICEADGGNGSNDDVTLNSTFADESIADGAIVCLSDREVHVEMPGTGSFSRCPENVAAMNPPPSMQQISEGAINVSVLDRELLRPCGAASPSNVPHANDITISNQLSLEEQNPDGVSPSIPAEQIAVEVPETSHEEASVSVSDRESPVEMPSTVNCPDYPENATPLNSSSMDQVSDGGSVLDGIFSSRPCGASSPSNGLAMIPPLNPPSLQQQLSDRVSLSIPDGQLPAVVPETSHEVAECQLTETVIVDRSTKSDQQEGVQRTMTENTLPQEAPVSTPAQSHPDTDRARETHNSFVSGSVQIEPANQSNNVLVAVEPPEEVQQLPSATEIEHQQTHNDTLSSHIPDASLEVPNQANEQITSNLEHDSPSHQVVQPASNLDLDAPMPSRVRRQSSDPRNLSTTSEISNRPIQTATQSGSRILPQLSLDPLKNELEIIRKTADQNRKNHEDMKLQLQSDFEKEMEELRRKYEVKLHNKEVEFQQQNKDLDTRYKTVLLNKALAEAFKLKCMDRKASGMSASSRSSYTTTSSQTVAPSPPRSYTTASSQTMVPPPTWPFATASSRTVAPPPPPPRPYTTPSSQTVVLPPTRPYTTASSQTVVPPPTRPGTSVIFSGVSARASHTNSIPSPSGNFHAGGEIRSPAPHLQPYRPPVSVSSSSQPASGNIPTTRTSFSNLLLSLMPKLNLSDPNNGPSPVSTGGLPTPNLSAMNLCKDANSQSVIKTPNAPSHISDLASLMPRFGTSSSRPANSSHQATSDVVCLSDDD